ncbi:MAG: DUF4125 family protein [Rhodocyclaceae bacterium]
MSIVDDIVAIEWQFMDRVQNEGGRANCQDDFGTFEIMRKSQFLCWDPMTLDSYYGDLVAAQRAGRNLVQEKYARMMASTAPAQYAAFAHTLPPLSEARRDSIERIIAIQLAWREDFARAYPQLSGQARLIRTAEDTPFETSFETYLRGELETYSEQTLECYKALVEGYADNGRNLTTASMNKTAMLYGYQDVDDAERKLAHSAG